LEDKFRIEFTVESDTWNTLWLIQKAINEGNKRKTPVRMEVKSGSVETTIQIVADIFTIGSFLLAMVTYIRLKREREKPIKVTKVSRDAAYAYALHHLKTVARVQRGVKLISERPTSDGGYHFEFADSEGTTHKYDVTKDFDVKYSREKPFFY